MLKNNNKMKKSTSKFNFVKTTLTCLNDLNSIKGGDTCNCQLSSACQTIVNNKLTFACTVVIRGL